MTDLNYRHLRYFRAVAHEGHLTRAAEKLNLSQSALSAQIKDLEARLGHALFERVGRKLVLTEVGQIALDYADQIFTTGNELMAVLARGEMAKAPLRVGALSTLSRNFQIEFLRPVLRDRGVSIALRSGNAARLLDELKALSLDVVLTTELPPSSRQDGFIAHRIAERPVALHGHPDRLAHRSLKSLLRDEPVILPTEAPIRHGFDALVARIGVQPQVVADVDDMAMIRLLARENVGVALSPSVVFANELESGLLGKAPFNLGLSETFFAITATRNFPHPFLDKLISD